MKYQRKYFCRTVVVVLTEGLHRRYPAPEEVEPKGDLPQLLRGRVGQAKDEQVDAVHVADEVVVQEVIGGAAGELPDGDLAHGAQ